MATITASTTYTDGAALDIAGHNDNIFSTTAGKGVLSEPNGGLEFANLAAGFTLRDEHVMSEEAVIARMESLTMPMDVYNNAFAQLEEDNPIYVPLGGLCQRVYVPFDMSAVMWQWSFFVADYRPYIISYLEDQLLGQEIPQLSVRLFVDGVEQEAFRRPLPVSADIVAPPADFRGSARAESNYENVSAVWYDISKLVKNVSKGWHEISIRVFMPRVTEINSTEGDEATIKTTAATWSPDPDAGDTDVIATVHTRVTLGSRSVRCVMFK